MTTNSLKYNDQQEQFRIEVLKTGPKNCFAQFHKTVTVKGHAKAEIYIPVLLKKQNGSFMQWKGKF